MRDVSIKPDPNLLASLVTSLPRELEITLGITVTVGDLLDALAQAGLPPAAASMVEEESVLSGDPAVGAHANGRAIAADALYDAAEVAEFLRLDKGSIYAIPDEQLPRRRVGAGGGKLVFWGSDVLKYLAAPRRSRRGRG